MTSRSPYVLQCCMERERIKAFQSMLKCLDRFGRELFLECNGTEVGVAAHVAVMTSSATVTCNPNGVSFRQTFVERRFIVLGS